MPTFELSETQKDGYFGRGFTGIKGGIPPELLKRLQAMADRLNIRTRS